VADNNTYYLLKITDEEIRKNVHRNAVGGLWEELGNLAFNFLLNKANLKPGMKILDLGSGCFRCGIKIVEYIDPANYFAIDLNEDLISAGFVELRKKSLGHKVPKQNIHITDDFDARIFGVEFDIVFAQSLWTHLPVNHIQRSLSMVEKVLAPQGSFYTTFFLCPVDHNLLEPYLQEPGGIITYRHRDPYHYRLEDFNYLIDQLNLQLKIKLIGDWNHPRNQQMLCFNLVG
jgi:cyclopropane fatty-acyl-phospholipid synthase-like methyltransferase